MNDGTIAKIRDGKYRAVVDSQGGSFDTAHVRAFEVLDVGVFRDHASVQGFGKTDVVYVPMKAWDDLVAAVERNADDTRQWYAEWTDEGGWAQRLTIMPNPWDECAK